MFRGLQICDVFLYSSLLSQGSGEIGIPCWLTGSRGVEVHMIISWYLSYIEQEHKSLQTQILHGKQHHL